MYTYREKSKVFLPRHYTYFASMTHFLRNSVCKIYIAFFYYSWKNAQEPPRIYLRFTTHSLDIHVLGNIKFDCVNLEILGDKLSQRKNVSLLTKIGTIKKTNLHFREEI